MAAPTWVTSAGRIESVEEESFLSVDIVFVSSLTATAELLSGEIPPGTILSKLSNTEYRLSGTVSAIPLETEYFFTLRVSNADGQIERGFSILVSQITPTWLTATRLATVVELDSIEHQFQLADPGGTATFTKIGGTLPPGLSINDAGLLKGRVEEVTEDTLYEFRVRAVSSEGTTIDKDFEIEVQVADGNRSPIWLTSSGEIGQINNGENSTLLVNAFDPDGDAITYTLMAGSLPAGLSLNSNTGAITGVCSTVIQGTWSFSIRASDGLFAKLRNFTISTNSNFDASIEWSTPAGLLGSLKIGENSLLSVSASSNYPIRFSISSGSLPQGLQLHPTVGDIYDDVQFQSIGTYVFTVVAENDFVQSSRQFSIEVTAGYGDNALRAYLQLPYQFIDEFREVIENTTIDRSAIYRPYDLRFGKQNFPKIILHENLNYVSASNLRAQYENNRLPLDLIVGDLKLAVARDTSGNVVYEVIYRDITEVSVSPSDSFIVPQTQEEITPTAINTLRTALVNYPGIAGSTGETLPSWMTSQQIFGVVSSILGFTPCIPIFFLRPGEGEEIFADLLRGEEHGNRGKGERLLFTSVNFETSVEDELIQDVAVHFHSLLSAHEQQNSLAINAPVWVTAPGHIVNLNNSAVVSISVQANDPNGLPRTYSLLSGTLPPGLNLAPNGIISGTISTAESKYWSFIISANSSSGYSRTRTFLIGTNI
jgi:hypothetical protein